MDKSEKKAKKQKDKRVNGFFADFKAFINKGNVLGLAVAVIIGGAFGKIVTSLVNDVIMPLITLAVNGSSVKDWKWVIKPAEIVDGVEKVAENALRYGLFLQAILDFFIIALFMFLAMRLFIRLKTSWNTLKEQSKDGVSVDGQKGDEQSTNGQPAEAADRATTAASETETHTPEKPPVEQLLTEIRDLLKAKEI
ncbi:MAG: large conductance mechanosensitive channel protein MscL [Firmicutes bacterium]|nr:large conductance mechanosensitive channel protein MscL [Bacillota bacterium]